MEGADGAKERHARCKHKHTHTNTNEGLRTQEEKESALRRWSESGKRGRGAGRAKRWTKAEGADRKRFVNACGGRGRGKKSGEAKGQPNKDNQKAGKAKRVRTLAALQLRVPPLIAHARTYTHTCSKVYARNRQVAAREVRRQHAEKKKH